MHMKWWLTALGCGVTGWICLSYAALMILLCGSSIMKLHILNKHEVNINGKDNWN